MSPALTQRSQIPRPQLLRQYNAGLESAACMLEQEAAYYRDRASKLTDTDSYQSLIDAAIQAEGEAMRIRLLKDMT